MQLDILIPIVFFLCITYAIKAVVDARTRKQMIETNGSQDLVRSMLEGEQIHRRHSSLRWGVTLVTLALGFAWVQAAGWSEVNPGVIAVLIGAVGIGNLAYYLMSRRLG